MLIHNYNMSYSEFKGKHGTLLCLKDTALFHLVWLGGLNIKCESPRALKKCKKITTVTGLVLTSPAVTELLASAHTIG